MSRQPQIALFRSALGLIAALIFLWPSPLQADVATEVTELTGAHTRVVWIRDAGAISDPLAERATSILIGFDNQDGKGERVILSTPSSYFRPLISPDGNQIFFSNIVDKKIYVVNWDGSGLKPVLEHALFADVITDPDGKIWIYAQTTGDGGAPSETAWRALISSNNSESEVSTVRRFRLDDPKVSEIVWNKTPVAQFQISPNGKFASGSSGDGEGLFTLPNGEFSKFYGGCWPSVAPDDSSRVWVFTGSHKGVHVFTHDLKTRKRTGQHIAFINAPGVPSSHEVYHPRWSNHLRFLTVTGPYWYKDWHWKEENKLSPEAAAKAEIYLGRFNLELEFVEKWVKITSNEIGDFFGDAWIDLKQNPQPVWTPPVAVAETAVPEWPGNSQALVFRWENSTANNQIENPKTKALDLCNLTVRGNAIFGRWNVMDTTGGTFIADESRNEAILQACRESGQFSLEATISPATLEQKDATIVSFGDNFALEQNGGELILWLKTAETGDRPYRAQLGQFIEKNRDGSPMLQRNHVMITYTAGILTFYHNGRQRSMRDAVQGDLSVWQSAQLIFGNNAKGTSPWNGTIEAVTIASRRVSGAEAELRREALVARAKERTALEPIVIKAKLVETTAAPSPDSITPYRRCLSVNVYDVESVEKGSLADKRIMVAHWSVLDAKKVPKFEGLEKGQSVSLTLEPFSHHPELEGERMVTDMTEDYQLFYSSDR